MKIYFFSSISNLSGCLILLNFLLYFNVIKSSSDFRSQRYKKQASSNDDIFRCKNGQTIDSWLVCDGAPNCNDISDETPEQCRNAECPSFSFKCAYGACIDAALKCNGKNDCADKSDESPAICPVRNVNTVCNDTQFQCISQQCIGIDLLCDGKRDCIDGSDETFNSCRNTPCNTNLSFRCKYGACVDGRFKCDGKVQCADGSDESDRTCKKPTPTPITPTVTSTTAAAPLPEGHCAIPISYLDKVATYKCSGSQKNCVKNGGTAVTEYTKSTFVCKPGYHKIDNKTLIWACLEGNWVPELPKCEKICDRLLPNNVDLRCYRGNSTIDCAGPLITGDRVQPTCKQLHTYKDFVPIYQELVCQDDGKWDNILFSCVPECGRPFTSAVPLISNGQEATYGDSPWHVAIYDLTKQQLLICGGTIINPYIVLSAAHCFHDRLNMRKLDAVNYEVVVGKFSRNYATKDNTDQRAFKLKEIRFSNKGYFATQTYFANDIAILILDGKIEIKPTVLPACVDWIHTEKYHPPEGTPGKVVGWGVNEHGRLSEKLLTANLPFISNSRCLSVVPDDFKSYITYDKFCAGNETGPSVLQGDSGGGLLFREGAFYYIRGIVSLKQPTSTAIAAFTDLADHITWILQVRNEVEREIIKKETTLASKT